MLIKIESAFIGYPNINKPPENKDARRSTARQKYNFDGYDFFRPSLTFLAPINYCQIITEGFVVHNDFTKWRVRKRQC